MKQTLKSLCCGVLAVLIAFGGDPVFAETVINRRAADLNSDGTVTVKDVTLLRRGIAGGYGVIFEDIDEEPDHGEWLDYLEGVTVSPDVVYDFYPGGLSDATGIKATTMPNRLHSGWIYCKGLETISPPEGYYITVAHCFDSECKRLGNGAIQNGMAVLLPGTSWVRMTIRDANDPAKDIRELAGVVTLTVSGADISMGRDLADTLYVIADPPVDPEWENWQSERYSWGFNPNSDKPYVEVHAPLEANMLSVRGGQGRWHTQEGNETDYLSAGFADGGHLFEGWNADESMRFTILIGKYDKRMACLYVYASPGLNGGEREYGYVKVGSDNAKFGVNFAQKSAQFFVPLILSSRRPTEVSPMWETDNNTEVPVGAMYYDEQYDTVMVMTKTGWKKCALTD